jgi:hypothetical protein
MSMLPLITFTDTTTSAWVAATFTTVVSHITTTTSTTTLDDSSTTTDIIRAAEVVVIEISVEAPLTCENYATYRQYSAFGTFPSANPDIAGVGVGLPVWHNVTPGWSPINPQVGVIAIFADAQSINRTSP